MELVLRKRNVWQQKAATSDENARKATGRAAGVAAAGQGAGRMEASEKQKRLANGELSSSDTAGWYSGAVIRSGYSAAKGRIVEK